MPHQTDQGSHHFSDRVLLFIIVKIHEEPLYKFCVLNKLLSSFGLKELIYNRDDFALDVGVVFINPFVTLIDYVLFLVVVKSILNLNDVESQFCFDLDLLPVPPPKFLKEIV